MKKNSENILCKPFVKWVGGKTQLMPEILKRIPQNINRYYEPFIGGGAVLFNLQPEKAYISDVNPELINTYNVIKSDVNSLIKDLAKHIYDKEYFYKIRDVDRSASFGKWSTVKRASRFIYLNKTCFNGLYRVNSSGHFNCPFGSYVNPKILDADNLRACSKVLQKVQIKLESFEEIADTIKKPDFVYFDPPYVPLSKSANFTSYSKEGFEIKMQQNLFELCCKLDRKGIRFMLSNSSASYVLDLYKQFNIELVSAKRAINSKGNRRGLIKEVIVTNY